VARTAAAAAGCEDHSSLQGGDEIANIAAYLANLITVSAAQQTQERRTSSPGSYKVTEH